MASHQSSVSMYDVAQEAGVSAQTVSRVANGSKLVRPETEAAVLAAMKKLGYRPNFAARALKRGHFKAVGVAMFDILATGNILTLEGITSAARGKGYAVTLSMLGHTPRPTLAETVEHMKKLPIDGIIIILERMVPDLLTYVPPPDFPITIITSVEIPNMSTIDEDQYGCSLLVVDYFLKRGHKNVHFVAGPEYSIASQFRMQGWQDALSQRGIKAPTPLFGDWSADSGYSAGVRLAHEPDCTAIYAGNDSMANGIIAGLEAEGKKIPDDVSIIGVDDSLRNIIPQLSLTSVSLDFAEVGRRAFDESYQAALQGERHEPRRTLIPGKIIERCSVKDLS